MQPDFDTVFLKAAGIVADPLDADALLRASHLILTVRASAQEQTIVKQRNRAIAAESLNNELRRKLKLRNWVNRNGTVFGVVLGAALMMLARSC